MDTANLLGLSSLERAVRDVDKQLQRNIMAQGAPAPECDSHSGQHSPAQSHCHQHKESQRVQRERQRLAESVVSPEDVQYAPDTPRVDGSPHTPTSRRSQATSASSSLSSQHSSSSQQYLVYETFDVSDVSLSVICFLPSEHIFHPYGTSRCRVPKPIFDTSSSFTPAIDFSCGADYAKSYGANIVDFDTTLINELPSYPLVTLRAKPGTRPKTLRSSSRDPALADYYIAPKARAHEKSKYYAISKGHNVGVFRNWLLCKDWVEHVEGAVHVSFENREEAIKCFKEAVEFGSVEWIPF
ncbi:hypothetical protein CERSUDRAFT_94251 [Gelatoporia subvermispora B]|uniref:Ribonuclease H1 N-terminal domain-containing protein n=1 Tax=Ceriporiopsis subvermispora (strain B) TaxID=914234 RepID=M2RFK4_CERS8|nr:hypothetical protein CERSUDRAFT_94251 [Gelatoporia subvermispora B]